MVFIIFGGIPYNTFKSKRYKLHDSRVDNAQLMSFTLNQISLDPFVGNLESVCWQVCALMVLPSVVLELRDIEQTLVVPVWLTDIWAASAGVEIA